MSLEGWQPTEDVKVTDLKTTADIRVTDRDTYFMSDLEITADVQMGDLDTCLNKLLTLGPQLMYK